MYLLDTHALLWWLGDQSRLSPQAVETIRYSESVYVSAASTWEIAIKRGLGKLDAPDDLEERIAANRFLVLPITVRHSLAVARLPNHHGDPFDRVLVAQALAEGMTLVSNDPMMVRYPVPILAA